MFLNEVRLAGNLTRDPQVRFLPNEKCVADFGLAINRKWRDQSGEMKEETTFVDVSAWGKTAENIGKYLTKGRNVFISGSIKLDQWEDKNTQQKRSKITILCQRCDFIGGQERAGNSEFQNPRAAQGEYQESFNSAPVAPSEPIDDEPPF